MSESFGRLGANARVQFSDSDTRFGIFLVGQNLQRGGDPPLQI